MQDTNLIQLKLKVKVFHKKDKKITTSFKPSNPDDVMNKVYLETKSLEIEGQLSFIIKENNDFKLHKSKQSEEDDLIERAVETNIQIFMRDYLMIMLMEIKP